MENLAELNIQLKNNIVCCVTSLAVHLHRSGPLGPCCWSTKVSTFWLGSPYYWSLSKLILSVGLSTHTNFFATSLLWKNVRFQCPVCHLHHISDSDCLNLKARVLELFVIYNAVHPLLMIECGFKLWSEELVFGTHNLNQQMFQLKVSLTDHP